MAILRSLTGKWKGAFTYESEYEPNLEHSVEFILDLTDENGTITGTCEDFQTKGLFDEQVIVSGFRDLDFISFTKQYPFLYYINEQGQVIVDRTKPHPLVTYSGEFNHSTNSFDGEWDMVVGSQKYGDGWMEDVTGGSWSMTRMDAI